MSVDAALNRVRNNLNENWLDWDVTQSELKDSTQALKELITKIGRASCRERV